MITIGKTIILTENEKPYQGECTIDVFNKAENVISIKKNVNTGKDEVVIIKNCH
jgi:hypothetical protein